MDGYRERLDEIRNRIDAASHGYDLAIIEARRQIERVDDLLNRPEAVRLARDGKPPKTA
jgi:hypothetical protein